MKPLIQNKNGSVLSFQRFHNVKHDLKEQRMSDCMQRVMRNVKPIPKIVNYYNEFDK